MHVGLEMVENVVEYVAVKVVWSLQITYLVAFEAVVVAEQVELCVC